MRLAGALMLLIAIGLVGLLEYFAADQSDRRLANTIAEHRYRDELNVYQNAISAQDALAANADAMIASCLREIDETIRTTRRPAIALVTGPGTRRTYGPLGIARCKAAVSEDQAILAGSSTFVTGGALRLSGPTVRRERVSASATRWYYKSAATTLLLSPASAATSDAYVRPMLESTLVPHHARPSSPAPPVLLPVSTVRYRRISILTGVVLGILGLAMVAHRSRGRGGRGEHGIVMVGGSLSGTRPADGLRPADARMIAQLHADLADLQPFIREMFRVAVRLNPINRQIYEFHQKIESINDRMERPAVCHVVKRAIMEVDLSNAVAALEDFDGLLKEEVGGILRGSYEDLARVMPDYRHRIPDLPDLTAAAEHSAIRIGEALLSTREELSRIEQHYRQLHEYLPRYEALMTRSGVLDFVLGFAAGFLGSEIASAGAELWTGWRDQSDQQFAESFSKAVDQFSSVAIAFTQSTEVAVDPVVRQVVGEFAEANTILIEGLRTLAARGDDITSAYRELRTPSPRDADTLALFNVVIANLREQGFEGKAERNVRSLLGM